jgi:hypothetical protein
MPGEIGRGGRVMGLIWFRSAGPVLLRVAAPFAAAAVLLAAAAALAQNAATSKFDHDPTGFPLTGTHVSVPCAACHINARFKTTPRNCFGCHNGMTAPGAASLLGAHPITTNYCEGCHQTTTWRDYRFIDHVQALGPCAACHNNKVAVGKTPQHPVTNAACNTCHFNTVTFKGGILATAIPQPAAKTPAASAATSTGGPAAATPAAVAPNAGPSNSTNLKTPNPQTSSGAQTSVSMRNTSGKPDHTSFVSGCARCHNGAVAAGKPAKHIATAAPCETCHKSTRIFAGARVDHTSLTGACATCHNGAVAEGRPRQHVLTTAPCDACHRTKFWTPATFRHTSPAFVNHGPGIGCESCHAGNSPIAAWKFPAFRPGCAGCHAQQYRPMAHVKFTRPVKVYYSVSELRDCTGSCHTYADSTMRTVVTRNFSRHRAIGGGW